MCALSAHTGQVRHAAPAGEQLRVGAWNSAPPPLIKCGSGRAKACLRAQTRGLKACLQAGTLDQVWLDRAKECL
eukprot:1141013-Pelagomonas_calceolata.AAC.8